MTTKMEQLNNKRKTAMEYRPIFEEANRKTNANFVSDLTKLGFEHITLASGWTAYCKLAHSAEEFSAVKFYYEDQSGVFEQYKVFFHLPSSSVMKKIKMWDTELIGNPPDWLRENLEFLCELARRDRYNRELQDSIEAAFEKARPQLEKELDDDPSKE